MLCSKSYLVTVLDNQHFLFSSSIGFICPVLKCVPHETERQQQDTHTHAHAHVHARAHAHTHARTLEHL